MWGTRAPTAKNLVATAIAMRPLSRSRKTIDQVIVRRRTPACRAGRRQRRARPLAGRQRAGLTFLEPADLAARADREAELGHHRRAVQPAARRRRRDHVAVLVDDVEMHRVAAHLAHAADRGIAKAARRD